MDQHSDVTVVLRILVKLDPTGARFAKAVRRTFDMLLDGNNTGRYRWEQLHKTEKTHCGTLVEINLQREFQFQDGEDLDYRIGGIEVDCKYSQTMGAWMIPPEAVNRILLLVWANDQMGILKVGIIHASPSFLAPGRNRDGKTALNSDGRRSIVSVFPEPVSLPDNVLLRLSPEDEDAIVNGPTGQQRVNELFRRVQQRPISRTVVATVAQQDDFQKRVRGNGGARSVLAAEGILILGQYSTHRRIAYQLGLPIPEKGGFVSARIAPRLPHHGDVKGVPADGREWVVATPIDPITTVPASLLRSPQDHE